MRNTHCRTWIMARKMKKVENEKQTLFDLEYVEKIQKHGKRKIHTVGPGVCTKTENYGQYETNNVGCEIC